ncbi:cation transporter [Acinetobacter oleivorans]|uniref:cation transporter n=1 Tax=Acinetobacter oleivorans TaxID=1148157 RepID=UPI003AF7BF2C
MSNCGCNKESSCGDMKGDNEKNISFTSDNQLPDDPTLKSSSCCGSSSKQGQFNKESDSCNKDTAVTDHKKPCCETSSTVQSDDLKPVTKGSAFISDYKIPKMDCSAEEQMVRMALSSLADIDQLVFDLPKRNLKVLHNHQADTITAKLETLGYGAKLNKTEAYINNKAKQTSSYAIPKMDCSAEEQMVRMTLAPVTEVKGLIFDLPNRKLQVFHNDGIEEITSKLESLGFGARLEKTVLSTGDIPNSPDPTAQVKVLKILLAINAVLFFIEFISGVIAASTGLIADSLDMFADAAVYGIALYAVGKAAKYQLKAAHFAGWIQLVLALVVIVDVIRRFLYGSEPESTLMIVIGFLALLANVTCLYLISGHKEGGAHMKASWIFSANDVIVNTGVILAGVLVAWTGSAYPDLIIGLIVATFVLNGSRKILALK